MFLWHLSLGFSSPSLDYNAFDFTFVPSGACHSSLALWCVSKGRISATFPSLQKTQALIIYVKGEGLCPDVTRGNSVWGRAFGWSCCCTDVSILSHVLLWSKKGVRQRAWLVGWLCLSSLDVAISTWVMPAVENSWDLLQPQHVGGIHCTVVERNCAGNHWASAESRTGFATPAQFLSLQLCSFQPVMLLCARWLYHHLWHLCALIPAQA